jgi:hypothetical protein
MTTKQSADQKGMRPSMKELADFLNTQQHGRIGTLGSDGRPQIANVAFSQTDTLKLIIGTSETSRKAVSLLADPRVAFEATDPNKRYTMQFEGFARRLSIDDFKMYEAGHFKKLPGSLPFKDIKGQAYFLLEPTWVRFSDCSVYPWALTEFTFNKPELRP